MISTLKKKTKKALAVLCMAAVLCAALLVAAPVQVQAGAIANLLVNVEIGGYSVLDGNTYVDPAAGAQLFNISFVDDLTNAESRNSVITLSDGTSAYTVSSGTADSAAYTGFVWNGGLNGAFGITLEANKYYTLTIPEKIMWAGEGTYWNVSAVCTFHTFAPGPDPNPIVPPTDAADHGSDEYYQRHYDFWVPVLAQLEAFGNGGTVTIDTAGQDIDHIMACVFGKLENTNRTLVIKHQGSTYTIRGSADVNGKMGGILLGHNHSFALLQALGYAR